ncbi:hypothetical protein [Peribacillus muralis]|uniref:hypothetical protein n=1 Tax=Peribacillus muralis TaxID=264697 RepID=UPI003CFD89CB
MRQNIINFFFILVIAFVLFFILSYDASLDNDYMLSFLMMISLQISFNYIHSAKKGITEQGSLQRLPCSVLSSPN